jgi:hypothetical protein
MNQKRRESIAQLAERVQELINEVESSCLDIEMEEIKEQEQEAFDAMPESLQNSERGEKSATAIEALEEAIETFNTIAVALEDVKTKLGEIE